MSKHSSRTMVVAAWIALVTAIVAIAIVVGVPATIGMAELWLIVGLVPSAVLLLLWRDAPPATIAEVLHTVNGPASDLRP